MCWKLYHIVFEYSVFPSLGREVSGEEETKMRRTALTTKSQLHPTFWKYGSQHQGPWCSLLSSQALPHLPQ